MTHNCVANLPKLLLYEEGSVIVTINAFKRIYELFRIKIVFFCYQSVESHNRLVFSVGGKKVFKLGELTEPLVALKR